MFLIKVREGREGGKERVREGGKGEGGILHVLYHFPYFDLLVMIYQLLLVLISSINLFNVILTYWSINNYTHDSLHFKYIKLLLLLLLLLSFLALMRDGSLQRILNPSQVSVTA